MTSCSPRLVGKKCLPGCVPYPAIRSCNPRYFWQIHYEPSFSCDFEMRLGLQGEGGKWICDPNKLAVQAAAESSCLIYSIGSHGQYDFEAAVHGEISPKCEIHTIDMKNWTRYTNEAPPPYVNYHIYTVGNPPERTDVSTIVRDLPKTAPRCGAPGPKLVALLWTG